MRWIRKDSPHYGSECTVSGPLAWREWRDERAEEAEWSSLTYLVEGTFWRGVLEEGIACEEDIEALPEA